MYLVWISTETTGNYISYYKFVIQHHCYEMNLQLIFESSVSTGQRAKEKGKDEKKKRRKRDRRNKRRDERRKKKKKTCHRYAAQNSSSIWLEGY